MLTKKMFAIVTISLVAMTLAGQSMALNPQPEPPMPQKTKISSSPSANQKGASQSKIRVYPKNTNPATTKTSP